jgi:hypothetical protein
VEKALKFAKMISRQAPADSTIENVYINRYTNFFKQSGFGQYSEWDDSFSILQDKANSVEKLRRLLIY